MASCQLLVVVLVGGEEDGRQEQEIDYRLPRGAGRGGQGLGTAGSCCFLESSRLARSENSGDGLHNKMNVRNATDWTL